MSSTTGRIIVYGGKGALGSAIIKHFKLNHFWVLNVDLLKNEDADENIIVSNDQTWIQQEHCILQSVGKVLEEKRCLDGIYCVAGGWAGGDINSSDMIRNADLMWKQSVWSSSIAARLASKFLKQGGLLQLTGAAAALNGSAKMLGYGLAKSAVHHLTKSLGDANSSMPSQSSTLAILPITLDTTNNRKFMPKADFSSWTPLSYIAELVYKWTMDSECRPKSGSLIKLTTINGNTCIDIC